MSAHTSLCARQHPFDILVLRLTEKEQENNTQQQQVNFSAPIIFIHNPMVITKQS